MTDNPFAPRPRGRYDGVIERVQEFTRSAMELAADEPVMVTEIACQLAGCPPRETVLVAMPHRGHWLKASVHKAMPEVTLEDVLWALRFAERVPRPERTRR
jgi:hypothetical protein